MKPGPVLSQKIGPLGMNIGEIIQKVNQKTESFKGLKVPVELNIDAKTKSLEVNVFSPPVSELLKKELGIEKSSGSPKEIKSGNLAIEQIIKVTKTKAPNMLSSDFKNNVKSIVGSCTSLGILIENEEPKKIGMDINQGKYDKEIEQQKTDVSPEKKKKLDLFFEQIQTKQKEKLRKEEEKKAAEEETKSKVKEGAEEKPEEAPGEGAEKSKEIAETKKEKKE